MAGQGRGRWSPQYRSSPQPPVSTLCRLNARVEQLRVVATGRLHHPDPVAWPIGPTGSPLPAAWTRAGPPAPGTTPPSPGMGSCRALTGSDHRLSAASSRGQGWPPGCSVGTEHQRGLAPADVNPAALIMVAGPPALLAPCGPGRPQPSVVQSLVGHRAHVRNLSVLIFAVDNTGTRLRVGNRSVCSVGVARVRSLAIRPGAMRPAIPVVAVKPYSRRQRVGQIKLRPCGASMIGPGL